MSTARPQRPETPEPLREVRLWIDGVGCWLIWLPETLTIGGPRPLDRSLPAADLPLLADLKRRHATITRTGDSYSLESAGPAAMPVGQAAPACPTADPPTESTLAIDEQSGRPRRPTPLRSGDEFTLGRDVVFQFSIPTPLSNTARLVCTSGHRPAERIDGVILLEQVCQIGPQQDHHIVCPRAETSLILYRKGGQLWCRSPQQWTLNDRPVAGAAVLEDGAVAATETLSFRMEVR